jgi:hypothetical protein
MARRKSSMNLRLRDIVSLEESRFCRRRERIRWSDYLSASVPVIQGSKLEKEWIEKLREKLKSFREL